MTAHLDPSRAEALAAAHLAACVAAIDDYEEHDDEAALDASPAVGPYCECEVCDRRELLAAYTPALLADLADLLHAEGYPLGAVERIRAEARNLTHPPLRAGVPA